MMVIKLRDGGLDTTGGLISKLPSVSILFISDEQLIKWFKPHGNEVLERQQSVIEPLALVTLSESVFL